MTDQQWMVVWASAFVSFVVTMVACEWEYRRRTADMIGGMNVTLTGPTCGYCGRPQRGSASAGDVPLCHPDFASRSDDYYVLVTVDHRPLPDGRRWTGSGWALVSAEFEARADELLERDREILDRLADGE